MFQRHTRVIGIAIVVGAEHELIKTAGRIRAVEREAEIEACASGEKIWRGFAGDDFKCFRQTHVELCDFWRIDLLGKFGSFHGATVADSIQRLQSG